MTWTFDYTVIFAIVSLAIILAGAFVYYLGMLFCDRFEIEFGKVGIPRRCNKIKYYKYGTLFLDRCATSTFALLILFFIILIQISFILKIDVINITDDLTDNNIFFAILVLDIVFTPVQFFLLSWNLSQIKMCDDGGIEYSKKLHLRCIAQSIIPILSLITVAIVSIFLIIISTPLINMSGNDLLHFILLMLLNLAFYVVLPVTFAFLNMSNIAILHGCFSARLEISHFKQVDNFFVYLIDGTKLDGHKLRYKDGIYTLSNSGNIESEYTIYEDKVRHVERVYTTENGGYADLDRIVA